MSSFKFDHHTKYKTSDVLGHWMWGTNIHFVFYLNTCLLKKKKGKTERIKHKMQVWMNTFCQRRANNPTGICLYRVGTQ